MQVKWKLLVSLGAIFFVSLCVKERLNGDILEAGEFSKLQDPSDSSDLSPALEDTTPVVKEAKEEEKRPAEHPYRWNQNTLWCIVITMTFCSVVYLVKVIKAKEPPGPVALKEDKKDFGMSTSSYDIVTLCAPKIEVDFRESEDCEHLNSRLVDAVKDFPVKLPPMENASSSIKPEKRYSNLKEQMVDLQISSWKEYGVLSKKLETVSKDKRQLSKQLKEAQKENEQLKQKFEDAVADRSSLIKKLESATREIKVSTQSKQQTLLRLEDAISTSNQLKEKLALMTKEKEALEEQLRAIELQYEVLKEQSKEFRISLDKYDRSSMSIATPAMTESEANMKESERNIEKVQHKLNDLENSLVKIKQLSSTKNSLCDAEGVSEAEDTEGSSGSREKDLEQKDAGSSRESVEKSRSKIPVRQKSENSISEKRQGEESNSTGSSEEGESCEASRQDSAPQITTDNPTQTIELVRMSDRGVELNVSTSTLMTDSCTSTDLTEDDSKGKFTPGIVSQSEAFQKFLIKVMDSPINCT